MDEHLDEFEQADAAQPQRAKALLRLLVKRVTIHGKSEHPCTTGCPRAQMGSRFVQLLKEWS